MGLFLCLGLGPLIISIIHEMKERAWCKFVRITRAVAGDNLRLRRVTCRKALPFRRTPSVDNLLRSGWEAQPPSRSGGGPRVPDWPESRRLSASQGGKAAAVAYSCQ